MLRSLSSIGSIHFTKTIMASKTVAVIGAGPGGLVAAKTLLHSHPKNTFAVTIFERSDRIGGIWSVTPENQEGIIPLSMPTNLSQFAVSFSDLAWSSVDLPGGSAYMNPKAWQVNRYLEEYRRRYLPEEILRLKTEVRSVKKDPQGGWRLAYARKDSTPEEQHFDFCIVASGFYSKPQPIRCQLDGFSENDAPVKIVHSSLYRGLDDILPWRSNSGKKLLVIGGANSGGEVAAALAFDISNAKHSPRAADLDYHIIHVVPKPLYGIPLFVPSSDDPSAFVPLDVRFYDLSKRPDQPVSLKVGRHTDESKRMLHGLVQGMLGNDPYENGQQKPLNEHQGELGTPKAAIQDNWASYVRSGSISMVIGRIAALHGHGPDQPVTASVQSSSNPGQSTILEDIAGVIYATGYSPELALRILPQQTLEALSYDIDYPRLPLLLPEDTLASNPAVPSLGFVGLYEGPYWGVMEMQARQLAKRWADSLTTRANSQTHSINLSERTQTRLASLLDIRSALKDAPQLVPQYIFSDYLAIMEESSRDLSLTRNDGPYPSTQGPITPSRYLDSGSNKSEADKTIASLQSVLKASSSNGRFIPHVIFRGLQGRWTLHRSLRSAKPEYPTGVFTGKAWFHPRAPTMTATSTSNPSAKSTTPFDQEYLYSESGTLRTDSGLSIPTYKNYVWRFREDPEKISVWFVKQDDSRSVDYLYHELDFGAGQDGSAEREKGQAWRRVESDGTVTCSAQSSHLCERDMYVTGYTFALDGVALKSFEVVHKVKGPNKDYISKTGYTR